MLAMSDAGFSARNKGGSVVVLHKDRPSASMRRGKIIFHKPHPVPKFDPVMTQATGKRMAKWFDWCKDIFILASSHH